MINTTITRLCVSLAMLLSLSAPAATLHVAGSGDDSSGASWATAYQTVQKAIDNATSGDTILLKGETFNLTSTINWTGKNLTLLGGHEGTGSPGARDFGTWPTILSMTPAVSNRVMKIALVPNARLESVLVTGGNAPGLGYPLSGGGIYLTNNTFAVLSNVIVSNNTAGQLGGGISIVNSIKTFPSTTIIENCTIISNNANCNASTQGWGGGLFALSAQKIVISGCTFAGNTAYGGNQGSFGGGIRLHDSNAYITNSLFINNWLTSAGATHRRGGALWAANNVTLDVMRSAFINNQAAGSTSGNFGGAIGFDIAYASTIRNSLFAGNVINGVPGNTYGSAIYHSSGNALTIENCTFAGNSDTVIYRGGNGNINLRNCILWGNEGSIDISNDGGKVATACCDIADGFQNGQNGTISANPLFAAPARGDYRLRHGSPCRDAGTNLTWMVSDTVDLRGYKRIRPPGGKVDIGAFEGEAPAGTTILITDTVSQAEAARNWHTNAAVRWRLLSDNNRYQEAKLETGVTYTWESAATNPSDSTGRRLLDGDSPSDWSTTTGWNWRDNAVVFDFQDQYSFGRVELNFHEKLPAYVEIQQETPGNGQGDPQWRTVARLDAPVDGWNAIAITEIVTSRRLRVFMKLQQWGVYFREARFYGTLPGDAVPPQPEPLTLDNQVVLAHQETPRAAIVVDCPENRVAVQAAWALHDTIKAMSGCRLPIFASSENPAGTRLVVGAGALAAQLGVTVNQSDMPGSEQYKIKSVSNDLVLAGNDSGDFRGTAQAAYDLLQRLGCGWYGPDPLYHVIPEKTTVSLPQFDVTEQPHFDMRDIWLVRNHRTLRDAWRLGGFSVRTHHTLSSLVPFSLRDAHPDWFGEGQPCLTHTGVVQHIVPQLRQALDAAPGRFLSISIGQNDNAGFCQCANCQAAGNFSARFVGFANAIADELRATHPGRFQLGFLAYWDMHTEPQPLVTARTEVVVLLVNEGDHTKPLDMEVPPANAQLGRNNLREQQALAGWLPSGALQGIYEWWIPGCGAGNIPWRTIPWYSGETALRNLRYWRGNGLRYLTYETGYENGNGFPLRWPLYHVAARGLWDSSLTSTQIMAEACAKLFGAAAEPMSRFYATLETAMFETAEPCGNWSLPDPKLVYTPAIVSQATDWLDQAAAVTPLSAAEQARIASERAMWDAACDTLNEL